MVKKGDIVEVRDTQGTWEEGVVESINSENGLPRVARKGLSAFEWDECRLVVRVVIVKAIQ